MGTLHAAGLLTAVALAAVALGACSPAAPPATAGEPPTLVVSSELLSQVAESERQRQRLVGLGVGVVLGGEVAYLGGFGYADLEAKEPLDPTKHELRWASISKTLTGALGARLAAGGQLDLDAPIHTVWPQAPRPQAPGGGPWAPGVTLRQLLSHTAGVMGYGDGSVSPTPPLAEQLDPQTNTGFAWALQRWGNEPLVTRPGAEYRYSTMGHNLAGAVIGAAVARSGEAPDAAFQRLAREVLNEAGVDGIQPDREYAPVPRRAKGYRLLDSGGLAPSPDVDVSWKTPGGGFISTVQSLTEYCAALAGERILDRKAKAVAWQPTVLSDGTEEDYGLGFGLGKRQGRRRVEHDGGQEKTRTRLVLYPDEGHCFVAMTNTESASVRFPVVMRTVTERLEDAVRGQAQ